jgi:hypothetical protein
VKFYILKLSFFFFKTSQKKELRKSFRPFFCPFWQIFDKNSAANLLGRTYFLPAPFEFCGRKFSQLATLLLAQEKQGSAPSTLSTYPPPHLPGVVGTQFTGSPQEGWIWTMKWRLAARPAQILCFWIM